MENSTPADTTPPTSNLTQFSNRKPLPKTSYENVCTKLLSDHAALGDWNARVAEIRKKDT